MENNKCVIPNTHNRLNEVHMLIHQTANNYFNPEGFRVNLDATIQAMRNLTFALQAEKGSIGDEFENWYSEWQEKMKNDSLMKFTDELVKEVEKRYGLKNKYSERKKRILVKNHF